MALLTPDSAVMRDAEYYQDDDSVILRAESTLFKVHKSRLVQMSAVFADLLALPQGEGIVDGQADEHPIMLAGDTAEEVRSLLWALYARPDEIVKYLADSDNNDRWMRVLYVAKLAHKYDCISLAHWALDAVAAHCQNADSIGSPEAVVTLVHLYSLADHRPNLDEWARPFIHRAAAAGHVDYATLFRAAAASSWDEIERHAYYRLVCGGAASWASLNLTMPEKLRLLAGYHNLNEVLVALTLLTFTIAHTCYNPSECSTDFTTIWRECCSRTLGQSGLDVLAICNGLNALLDSVETYQIAIWGVRLTRPGSYVQIPVPTCFAYYRRAVKDALNLGNKVVQRCFDEEYGLLSRNSPEVSALWEPPSLFPPFVLA